MLVCPIHPAPLKSTVFHEASSKAFACLTSHAQAPCSINVYGLFNTLVMYARYTILAFRHTGSYYLHSASSTLRSHPVSSVQTQSIFHQPQPTPNVPAYHVALDGFGLCSVGVERLTQHTRVEEAIYAKEDQNQQNENIKQRNRRRMLVNRRERKKSAMCYGSSEL